MKKKEKIDWTKNPLIKIQLNRKDKDNIFVPELDIATAKQALIQYLIAGGQWTTTVSLSQGQELFALIEDILYTYSKTFRQEYEQYNEYRKNLKDLQYELKYQENKINSLLTRE